MQNGSLDGHKLCLGFGLRFDDLYKTSGLARLDGLFLARIHEVDAELSSRIKAARSVSGQLDRKMSSDLMLELAPYIDDFVGELFDIEHELEGFRKRCDHLGSIHVCKRRIVQRLATRRYNALKAADFDGLALETQLARRMGSPISEEAFAEASLAWEKEGNEEALDEALRYAAWAALTPAGHVRWPENSVLFRLPNKRDPHSLVPFESEEDQDGVIRLRLSKSRVRDGFHLTDQGTDLKGMLDQAHYCIWCHERNKDSCSHGLKAKQGFAQDAFGNSLAGCPLEVRISEMNLAKTRGCVIGALAIVCADNPLCASTGHRICNDCMKSCIYQKQDPVDIPQIESRVLRDVLELSWGFEIYSLLTRWTPLDFRRPFPKPDSGRKVLIVGTGPAGFNLAHHLLSEGHAVVAIDGLKIEPEDSGLSGIDMRGQKVPFSPIFDIACLQQDLSQRVPAGFGGVTEYGITVRWDKNFLRIIRLLLERRALFRLYGGIRFGSNLTVEDALDLGFDHIALCLGAGRPTIIDIPGNLAKGVRMASDFLMALQLTGAARQDSLANLQLRLPVVIIGGGLTAVDTATEALAYYPIQVEKFAERYEKLVAQLGSEEIWAAWSKEEAETAHEFLAHARAVQAERVAAIAEGRQPQLAELVRSWGGVTLAYRRRMVDAPCYTGNHEELIKALEEGIACAECLSPEAIETDQYGHAQAVRFRRMEALPEGNLQASRETVRLAARGVLIAAGTKPNTVLAREMPELLPPLDGAYFQAFNKEGQPVSPERITKPAEPHIIMACFEDKRSMSFWGDLHPSFAGNVVRAVGGVKQAYPDLSASLMQVPAQPGTSEALFAKLDQEWRPHVLRVDRLAPDIVEITLQAPAQARHFQPGQFFRLQNFEALAPKIAETRLAMESLALTGARVDRQNGSISTIVLEMGGSSDLCAFLKPGEPVVLMGPTGIPTEIPKGENLLLMGGGLGNAVLFSIGQALRAAGSNVLYFAGYKRLCDRYHIEEIEQAADKIIWCCDEAPGFTPDRASDHAFCGNILEAVHAYAEGRLGYADIPLAGIDRMIVIGSDRMMAAIAKDRQSGVLARYLKPGSRAIASVNSPMQCMMKEICAQCLQRQRDPATGLETIVFTCFNQDQDMDYVDFASLSDRLSQNAVQEKLSKLWIRHYLKSMSDIHQGQ